MKTPKRPQPPIQCRARPSWRLKQEILEAQQGRCLACDTPLAEVDFDHTIPLGLGGCNTPDNWAALCRRCHRKKTAADLRRIAKAKRQRRYHETGRSRSPKTWGPFGPNRGFDRDWRRHVDGHVTRRCACAACAPKQGDPDAT